MKKLLAILVLLLVGVSLVTAIAEMPTFGSENKPDQNEVPERYLEKGYEETGNRNIVSAILVDYRAFDTFGELTVLFTAVTAVLTVLTGKEKG